ncbi:MAG: carboxypeptidase regulatory-like domain-containing protein [Silvibacterium sp.]
MYIRPEGRGALRTFRLFAYSLLVLMLSVPLGLHAQQYSGTIVGTVTDSTGAVIPGATITAINTGTSTRLTQTSGGQGEFTFAQLPVGTYEVHVTQGNFKEFVETGVVVHTSTNTEVHAVLQVGSQTQTVTVAADAIQVQTTSAAVGEVVTGTQVRELPLNGENFVGLTQLSPGVSAAQGSNFSGKGLQGGVNFSVNGNPYNSNLFLVDGVNNNDVGSGRTILVYPAVDTIAEFKMIRNSYGPEYGQAAGAVISITTRSGENQVHGGFFYSGRNNALDANDWFSNNLGIPNAAEHRSDYGYNVSGPVVKDKLFLWWNQEWDKEVSGANGSYGTCVPTASEESGDFTGAATGVNSAGEPVDQCGAQIPTIPTYDQAPGSPLKIASPDAAGLLMAQFYPTGPQTLAANGDNWSTNIGNKLDWSEWNVRADYQLTKGERATFRWTQDNWTNPQPNNPTGTFWGDSAFPTVMSNWSQPSKSVMAKLTSTISSTLVNDVEFGYGHNAIITTLGGTKASIVPAIATAYPANFPSSIKTPGEFFGWGGLDDYAGNLSNSNLLMWNIAPYGNHEDLYSIQDNLSKVWGNHLFKAGIFITSNEKVENSGDGADTPSFPGYSYDCGTCTGNELANLLLPGTGTTPQVFSGIGENSIDGIADVHWHDFEPYFGDTWKISRNVTLDLGARWSIFREPYGGTKGGNTDPAANGGGNYANQWANWNPADWSASEAAANPTDACNGIEVVPGTNPCASQKAFLATLGVDLPLSNGTPGANAALVQQNLHDIAPRVGVAWDVRGDGRTALRAGGGEFFQREVVGLAENLARNAPFVLGISTNRTLDTPTPLSGASVSPNASKSTDGNLPGSWQWNITVDQELARNTTLEVSYVGNTGVHLTSMYQSNAIPSADFLAAAFATTATTPSINSYRPASNFGDIGGFARGGHASYNSLQALFRMQTGNFSTFQAAYTWGHSIGNVDLDNSSGTVTNEATTDQEDPGLDKGNTNINRPNIFVANEVFFLPKLASHGMLIQNTLGGWEANSIVSLAEGSSLTIYSAGAGGGCTDLAADGTCLPDGTSTLSALVGTGYTGNNRPLVTNVGCNADRVGPQLIDLNHFTLVGYPLGTFPSNMEHRGSCLGAPNTDMDGQLAKNWYIKEKYRLKFSMDFFNLFNHPNFNSGNLEGSNYTGGSLYCGGATPATVPGGGPSGQPCSPTNNIVTSTVGSTAGFGAANAIQGTARELQYALKFSF